MVTPREKPQRRESHADKAEVERPFVGHSTVVRGVVYATLIALGISQARPVWASDLSEALTFAQGVMGDVAVDGLEDFIDQDPNEALALLLSPTVEPDRPPSEYPGAAIKRDAPFTTLGPHRLSFGILRPYIEEASRATGMPVALIDAVIRTESGYRPGAVSRAGAQGLMQLMPSTARALGVTDPFDPRENILAGAQYLRKMYDQFGALPLAIAAYNAGPGRVAKAGGIPAIKETRRYVAAVLRRYRESPIR